MINFQKVQFIKSAALPSGFIDDGPQIVFSGRSNVGKSSVINRLLGRKNMARVGAAPGKTAHINYFLIDEKLYFVDLPGYGYAKVPQSEKTRWAELMEAYFAKPERIALAVMIVDARHVPTADDIQMARWYKWAARPLIILANKADKVKKTQLETNLSVICDTLQTDAEILPFSAQTGTGRDELIAVIEKSLDS
jgi:GTP-binding protein